MFILVFWIRKKKIKDNCYWIIPFSPNPGQRKLLYSRMKIQKFPFERVCLAKIFISKIGRKIINKEAKIEEFLRGSSSKTLVSKSKTMITFETREKFFLGNNYHRLCVIHAPPPIFLPLPSPEKKTTCSCAYVSPLLHGRNEQTNSDNCHRVKNNSR